MISWHLEIRLNQRRQNFHQKNFSKQNFFETLIKEMSPVVMDDKWRWYWMSGKFTIWMVLLEVSDSQDSQATNRVNEISTQNTCASVMFQIEFLLEELENSVAEENKSVVKFSKTNNNSFFRSFWLSRHWWKEQKPTILSSKKSLQPESSRERHWSERWSL